MPTESSFRSHDRLDVEASHELDVVHRKHIGGSTMAMVRRRANAAQRKNLVTFGGFEGNQLDYSGVNFKIGKVDSWDPY